MYDKLVLLKSKADVASLERPAQDIPSSVEEQQVQTLQGP
jgi:hypothetical protein